MTNPLQISQPGDFPMSVNTSDSPQVSTNLIIRIGSYLCIIDWWCSSKLILMPALSVHLMHCSKCTNMYKHSTMTLFVWTWLTKSRAKHLMFSRSKRTDWGVSRFKVHSHMYLYLTYLQYLQIMYEWMYEYDVWISRKYPDWVVLDMFK